jgi:uncharacterized protein (DUF4415 family)
MNRKPLIDEEGEVRELTQDDIKRFKPSAEVLPAEHFKILAKRGRPRKAQPKLSTTVRLDPEVLEYFRATGKGWQTRLNEALREYVISHK